MLNRSFWLNFGLLLIQEHFIKYFKKILLHDRSIRATRGFNNTRRVSVMQLERERDAAPVKYKYRLRL